jgi:DNA-binding CsgD family transcriptional regulator
VCGSSVGFDELLTLSALADDQLTAALRKLCDVRLLVESARDEFTFSHALTRQVVEGTMLARERRSIHRRILGILPPDVSEARIVHHALGADDVALARSAAAKVAPVALAAGQPTRARDMALLAISANPDHSSLGVLAQASWQLRDRPSARRAAEQMLLSTPDDRIVIARMRWLLARLAWETLDAIAFRSHVADLASLFRDATFDELPELLTMHAELKMLVADPDEVACGEQAVIAATGTPFEDRAKLNLGSSLTSEPGRREEGRAILMEIVRSHRCDSFNHARALNNLLCDLVYAELPANVLPIIDELEQHVVATGLVSSFAEQIPLFREQCAERIGDRLLAESGLAWFGPVAPEPHTCLAAAVALLELDSGSPGDVCRAVTVEADRRRDRVDRDKLVWTDAVAVQTAAHDGDADVKALLDQLFDPAVQGSRYMIDAIETRGRAAVVLARKGSAQAAATLARWRAWVGDDPDAVAVTAHLEAIAAEATDDHATAIKRYRDSLHGLPIRSCTVYADALRGLARCTANMGDREQARTSARQAVEKLAHWPGTDRDQCIRLLRELGGRPTRSRTDQVLSDREVEVAALITQGLTNREIGDSLGIAPRTVGVHVTHILEKLGVSKRSQIAAHVARHEAE